MSFDGKGPVSGSRLYTRLLPGAKGGEAILKGANFRAAAALKPAGRPVLVMGTDNLAQAPIQFVDNRLLAGVANKIMGDDLTFETFTRLGSSLKGFPGYRLNLRMAEAEAGKEGVTTTLDQKAEPVLAQMIESLSPVMAGTQRSLEIIGLTKLQDRSQPADILLSFGYLNGPQMPIVTAGEQVDIPASELLAAIGPQHLIMEDIQGTNPKDRGIVLGADPKSPRFEDAGPLCRKAAPRRMGFFQQLYFWNIGGLIGLWRTPKAPLPPREEPFRTTTDADVRQTRASRLLAMVRGVLRFDVTAWLRGNKK
jgi:hypothetical protein